MLRARAREVQASLEATPGVEDAAWAALGVLYERLGDLNAEALVLERRVNLSRNSSRPPADPDLFYRLAAVRLSDPEARAEGHSSAEAVYRTVVWLRDQLSADAQIQLAVCFEWAREGIARQSAGEITKELQALHAAYSYARDVMLARSGKGIDK